MRPNRWNLVLAAAALLVLAVGVPLLAGQLRDLGGASSLAARADQRIVTLEVGGMHCTGCEGLIRAQLVQIPGVTEAEVRWPQRRAYVVTERAVPDTALLNAVHRAGPGYLATVVQR
jgi:copper chaperone CopZ